MKQFKYIIRIYLSLIDLTYSCKYYFLTHQFEDMSFSRFNNVCIMFNLLIHNSFGYFILFVMILIEILNKTII